MTVLGRDPPYDLAALKRFTRFGLWISTRRSRLQPGPKDLTMPGAQSWVFPKWLLITVHVPAYDEERGLCSGAL